MIRRDFVRIAGLAALSRALPGCYFAHPFPEPWTFSDATPEDDEIGGFACALEVGTFGGVLGSAHGETYGSGPSMGE